MMDVVVIAVLPSVYVGMHAGKTQRMRDEKGGPEGLEGKSSVGSGNVPCACLRLLVPACNNPESFVRGQDSTK